MTDTVSSSWISALRKVLVMSMLDHVVSAEHARLSINRKSGASRLVVVVVVVVVVGGMVTFDLPMLTFDLPMLTFDLPRGDL